ncbi:MAG TPA: flavodoxin [bacterium]|nr:flavodoxin [bacterium]
MKSLIVYYSHSGSTEKLSKELQTLLNADVLKLQPDPDLGNPSFLNYIKGGWHVLRKHLPKLTNKQVNIDDYDLIAIGTPVWFGSFTPAIRSFLKDNPIKNKKLVLFANHRGGLGNTFSALEKAIGIDKNQNQIISEFALNHKYSADEQSRFVQEWFTEIMNYLER